MRSRNSIVLAGVILLLLIGMYAIWQQGTRYDWQENYDDTKKDPYGTQVLRYLLEDYFPNEQVVVLEEGLKEKLTDEGGANYVFTGGGMYMDSLDTQELLQFVERGNTAFISTKVLPQDLMFYALDTLCDDLWWEDFGYFGDTSVTMNFLHPELAREQDFVCKYLKPKSEVEYYTWNYIEEVYFCEADFSFAALGYLGDSLINFARFSYGEGDFYIHSTPLAFTNIQLLEKEGLAYANRVFSHLVEGTIYWDSYSQVPERVAQRLNNPMQPPNRRLSDKSPLQYVLSQPPLAWAWYLALAMGLLYMLFRAKRQQRIIPVLEKNENTSLTFVKNIGHLYFLQNNHRLLALQKVRLFLADVRERYHINTTNLDDNFVQKLHTRSGVAVASIEKLLLLHRNIQSSSFTSENVLIEVHQLIERFRKEH